MPLPGSDRLVLLHFSALVRVVPQDGGVDGAALEIAAILDKDLSISRSMWIDAQQQAILNRYIDKPKGIPWFAFVDPKGKHWRQAMR